MKREEVLNQFKQITAEYTNVAPEDMTEQMSYIEDLGFSSFDFMAYLGDLEDEFDVEVNEEEAFKLRTIGDAIAYIDSLL